MQSIQESLEALRKERYNLKEIQVFDPISGEPKIITKNVSKLNLDKKTIDRLDRRERGMLKVLEKYKRAMVDFPKARALERDIAATSIADGVVSTEDTSTSKVSSQNSSESTSPANQAESTEKKENESEKKKGWNIFKYLGFK
jgi:hypothetical protein